MSAGYWGDEWLGLSREGIAMARAWSYWAGSFWAGVLGVGLGLSLAGCGGGQVASQKEEAIEAADWTEAEVVAHRQQVEQVVSSFFEGLRAVNLQKIDNALTKKARENNLIEPESQRNAVHKIAEIQIKSKAEKIAYAVASWDFLDDDGKTVIGQDQAIWALRLEPEGWRIAGSIMRVPDLDDRMVALDFEDKVGYEDTVRAMEQEIMARAKSKPAAKDVPLETARIPADDDQPRK